MEKNWRSRSWAFWRANELTDWLFLGAEQNARLSEMENWLRLHVLPDALRWGFPQTFHLNRAIPPSTVSILCEIFLASPRCPVRTLFVDLDDPTPLVCALTKNATRITQLCLQIGPHGHKDTPGLLAALLGIRTLENLVLTERMLDRWLPANNALADELWALLLASERPNLRKLEFDLPIFRPDRLECSKLAACLPRLKRLRIDALCGQPVNNRDNFFTLPTAPFKLRFRDRCNHVWKNAEDVTIHETTKQEIAPFGRPIVVHNGQARGYLEDRLFLEPRVRSHMTEILANCAVSRTTFMGHVAPQEKPLFRAWLEDVLRARIERRRPKWNVLALRVHWFYHETPADDFLNFFDWRVVEPLTRVLKMDVMVTPGLVITPLFPVPAQVDLHLTLTGLVGEDGLDKILEIGRLLRKEPRLKKLSLSIRTTFRQSANGCLLNAMADNDALESLQFSALTPQDFLQLPVLRGLKKLSVLQSVGLNEWGHLVRIQMHRFPKLARLRFGDGRIFRHPEVDHDTLRDRALACVGADDWNPELESILDVRPPRIPKGHHCHCYTLLLQESPNFSSKQPA